ncbi:TonB-dependent receptor [Uliginosibacterium sp. 31-12]|uniref:TonB-dependent receptor n=1 Tax=Uliginosibacterium sp. 31-12 TaxID=3062781 RepID=UPI0026E2C951|nr:TonB-dependent receptor [Uliginosibacterium sp. 31-12]MDO6386979.1 TonB-dependent receptor [Uliginosibacterium sp. 31-12]
MARHASLPSSAQRTLPRKQGLASFAPSGTTSAVRSALMTGLMLGAVGVTTPMAYAQSAAPAASAARSYNIQAGPLDRVLNSFAAIAGVEFSSDASLLQGRSSRGLSGIFTVEQGFAELLRGQGLNASRQGNGSYILVKPAEQGSRPSGEVTLAAVKVTGTTVSPTDLPASYAGGQVARGAKLGVLGNVDVMDAPFNVTAYTAQAIADQQAATVGEVLRNDPSVRFTTSDGHNAENITIRGFEINSSELAFNGMYGMLPGAHVPTEFVERVEVFKGPAAMLSGIAPSGAVGGVVNLVTKRATEQDLTRLTTSYASNSHLTQAADIGRRFGAEKRLGVRFNGSLGYGETTLEDQKKRDNFSSLGLDYRGDRWKMELDAYSAHQNQSDGSPLMVGFSTLGRVIDAPDTSKNALRGTYAHQRTDGAMLRGEVELTRGLSAYAALGTANYNYDGFINGTRVVLTNANGNATGQTYNQAGYTRSSSGETGLRSSFSTGSIAHQMVASFAQQHTTTGLATVNTSASYVTNIYDPKTNPTIAGAHGAVARSADNIYSSLALADTLSLFEDSTLLTLGARSQSVKQKMATPTAYEESAITPMLGLVVKPWGPEVSLYANYIEGLSPGVVVSSVYANEGETLAPYKTRQKEVGVKWEHGSFINTFSLFSILKPSTISVATSASRPTLALDGEQKNQGFEWTIAGQLSRQVRMLGGAAYTVGEQVRAATAANDGKKAPGVPAWTANLGSEWDLPWISGLTLNGRVTYTSAQYLDAANKLELPSWTRWDAGANYALSAFSKPVVLRFAVENLTDEHYWSGRFGEGFATLGAPRTYKLSATVDF